MNGVRNAKYQLISEHGRWQKVLRGELYVTRLSVVVIDEVHTVIEW